MSVTIRKYKRGGWEVDLQITYPGGSTRRERKKAPVPSKSGARRWGEARERELLLAGPTKPKKEVPIFAKFADEFLTTYAKASNKPSEVRSKTTILRNHLTPAFGRQRLDAIGVRDIDHYKTKKIGEGLTAKTINNQLTVLRKCLSVAMEWELLSHLPAVKWLKTVEPEFDFLDFDEAARLVDAAKGDGMWGAMIFTALRTGLRMGELRALRWQDVDLVARKLVVRRSVAKNDIGTPKSGRSREVDLSPELVCALKVHRHLRSELAFCHETGRMLTENECKHPLWRACKRAGLREIGWHTLRHTFASQLVMRGAPAQGRAGTPRSRRHPHDHALFASVAQRPMRSRRVARHARGANGARELKFSRADLETYWRRPMPMIERRTFSSS